MTALSPYIFAAIIAWLSAQGIKAIIAAVRHKSVSPLKELYLSGGMPSAHSATVVALTTTIMLIDGINSVVFGVSLLFSAIVMYDAMMVRYAVGEQGKVLNQLIDAQKIPTKKLRITRGHTPLEVAAGAFLGLCIGIVVFLATK